MTKKKKITKKNCVSLCKKLWEWMVKEYGNIIEPKETHELKGAWPEWKQYTDDSGSYCPLCSVFYNENCASCPLDERGSMPGCMRHDYEIKMNGKQIKKFNKVIQGLK